MWMASTLHSSSTSWTAASSSSGASAASPSLSAINMRSGARSGACSTGLSSPLRLWVTMCSATRSGQRRLAIPKVRGLHACNAQFSAFSCYVMPAGALSLIIHGLAALWSDKRQNIMEQRAGRPALGLDMHAHHYLVTTHSWVQHIEHN